MFRRSWATFDRRRRARSRPPTTIRPEVGSKFRAAAGTIVDFPEPEGPTRKTNSPFSITNEAPSSATTFVVNLVDVLEHDHRPRGGRGVAAALRALVFEHLDGGICDGVVPGTAVIAYAIAARRGR